MFSKEGKAMKIGVKELMNLRERLKQAGAKIEDYMYTDRGEVGFFATMRNNETGLYEEAVYYSLPFGYLTRIENHYAKENEFIDALNEHKNHLSFYWKADWRQKQELYGFVCIHSGLIHRHSIHIHMIRNLMLYDIFLHESMRNKLIKDTSKSFLDVAMDDRYMLLR